MLFMTCTTCTKVVQVNPTGTCLGCQRGFVAAPQEDAYEFHKEEVENAIQKQETKELDVPKQSSSRSQVSKRNTKRSKSAKKNKKNKKKKEIKK